LVLDERVPGAPFSFIAYKAPSDFDEKKSSEGGIDADVRVDFYMLTSRLP